MHKAAVEKPFAKSRAPTSDVAHHDQEAMSQDFTKCNSQYQAGILIIILQAKTLWCTRRNCQASCSLLSRFCCFENLKPPAS